MTRILNVCCIAASLLLSLGSAKASTAFYQFSGTVTQVPLDEVFGDITFGEAFQGSFTFDTSAVDLIPADLASGDYASTAPFGMTVTIGTHDFSTSGSLNIGVLNSFIDQYTVLGTSASDDLTLELFLQDVTGTVFANDHLPVTPPPLTAFAQKDFHLDALLANGEVQIDGQLSALDVPGVPEPSQGLLVLAGVIVLLIIKQHKLTTEGVN